MDPALFWYVVAAVLALVGLAGVILPALPGLPLVFAGMLVAAWAGDFQRIGPVTLVLLALLTALSVVADFVATAAGAKRVGAGPLAVWAPPWAPWRACSSGRSASSPAPSSARCWASCGIPAPSAARRTWGWPPGWACCWAPC